MQAAVREKSIPFAGLMNRVVFVSVQLLVGAMLWQAKCVAKHTEFITIFASANRGSNYLIFNEAVVMPNGPRPHDETEYTASP